MNFYNELAFVHVIFGNEWLSGARSAKNEVSSRAIILEILYSLDKREKEKNLRSALEKLDARLLSLFCPDKRSIVDHEDRSRGAERSRHLVRVTRKRLRHAQPDLEDVHLDDGDYSAGLSVDSVHRAQRLGRQEIFAVERAESAVPCRLGQIAGP